MQTSILKEINTVGPIALWCSFRWKEHRVQKINSNSNNNHPVPRTTETTLGNGGTYAMDIASLLNILLLYSKEQLFFWGGGGIRSFAFLPRVK